MQNKNRNWGVFMFERLKKLYPLLITGFVFFYFYSIVINDRIIGLGAIRHFLYRLLFVHTLIPGQALTLTGPWWFFGLIFQLYLLFPLLFKLIKKHNVMAFTLICLLSYIWIYITQYVYSPKADIMLFQNAPGHLPEFALGILFALNPKKRIHFIWGLLALVIFSLGNFYQPFFPLTFLSVTILFWFGIEKAIPFILNKTKVLKTILLYYDSISMILFVIHGPLRNPFISASSSTFYGQIFAAFLFLIVATALSILGKMLYQWMVNKINTYI